MGNLAQCCFAIGILLQLGSTALQAFDFKIYCWNVAMAWKLWYFNWLEEVDSYSG